MLSIEEIKKELLKIPETIRKSRGLTNVTEIDDVMLSKLEEFEKREGARI